MHKGKVDVRGSPSDVSNKYGIASKIFLVDVKTENEKNEILEQVKTVAPEIKIDDSKFLEKARLELTLGIEDKKKLGKVVEILEEKKSQFYLSANSLEQAYINLGKSKSIEKPDLNDSLLKEITKSTFNLTKLGIIKMLIYRRYRLIITSPQNWLKLTYLCLVPPMVATIFNREGEFDNQLIFVFNLFYILYAFSGNLIFSQVPFEERTTKRRYLLKLMGVDSVIYYVTLLFSDFSLLLFTYPISFLVLIIGNAGKLKLEIFENFDYLELAWNLAIMLAWSFGYFG